MHKVHAVLLLLLAPFPLAAVSPVPKIKPQIRALWVDAFHAGIRTPEEADKLVADALAAHLNLLVVQVRRRGDAYYTKSLEPPPDDPDYKPGFDSLGYILEKAHAAGLKVHAWMNVTPVWRSLRIPPSDPAHIFRTHGPSADGAESWISRTFTGEMEFPVGYFLDPGHPAAARHIAETILHVVKNYPVDGVHLDYIRYAELEREYEESGAPVGYNPVSVERFHKRYGGSGVPAPNDPKWSDWRREQVTNLVRRIYLGIQEANPGVELSAALIPWWDSPPILDWVHTHPYWRVFQDWQSWLRDGLLDLAIPMNYAAQANARNRGFFEHWIEFEKNHKYGRRLAVGMGAYLNSPGESLAQTRRALARSRQKKYADGFAVYSYYNNGKDGGVLPRLAALGPTPPLPPKTPARDGHIAGVLPQSDGMMIEIARKAGRNWAKPVRVISDGNGFFGAAHLRPGDYRVRTEKISLEVKVEAGKLSRADF